MAAARNLEHRLGGSSLEDDFALIGSVMTLRVTLFASLGSLVFGGIALADDGKIVVADVESVEHGKMIHLQWSAPASRIASLQKWNPNIGKFPLSIDDAIKIARDRLTKAFPAVKEWKLDEISLREIKNNGKTGPSISEKYCYLVYLLPSTDHEAEEIEKSLDGELSFYEVILPDGSALEPQRIIGFDQTPN